MEPSDASTLGELAWHVAPDCDGGSCVRIAQKGDMVLIGDSKDPDGRFLAYTRAEWRIFTDGIKHGYFDDFL